MREESAIVSAQRKGLVGAGIPRDVDRLYKAVQHYVQKHGGNITVIGGIQIIHWPYDGELKFTVAVQCLGRKPFFDVQTDKRATPVPKLPDL